MQKVAYINNLRDSSGVRELHRTKFFWNYSLGESRITYIKDRFQSYLRNAIVAKNSIGRTFIFRELLTSTEPDRKAIVTVFSGVWEGV